MEEETLNLWEEKRRCEIVIKEWESKWIRKYRKLQEIGQKFCFENDSWARSLNLVKKYRWLQQVKYSLAKCDSKLRTKEGWVISNPTSTSRPSRKWSMGGKRATAWEYCRESNEMNKISCWALNTSSVDLRFYIYAILTEILCRHYYNLHFIDSEVEVK